MDDIELMDTVTEIVTTKTTTLGEEEIKRIVQDYLGPEYAKATTSLYTRTIPASSVMGAIDDSKEIVCQVKLYSKETT